MAQQYDIGDMVRCSVIFKNLNDAVIDPTTITLKIKLPNATVLEYVYLTEAGLIKDSVGNYHYDFLITMDGMHIFKWIGTGNVYAVEESSFFVNPTKF
jgi:hypothetical protein